MNRLRVLALGVLCALMLMAAVPTHDASALPLALSGNGSGSESDNCAGAMTATCSGTLNAGLKAKFIGKSTMTLNLTIVVAGTDNGSGGTCTTATGTGQINTANKSTITVSTVGAICNVGGPGTQRTYNATYFIDGGTNHFPAAAGTGLFVASIDGSGNAIVTLSGGFIK